jgi:hypothetical protein
MTATFVSEDAAPVGTEADASGNTYTDACSVPTAANFSDELTDAEDDDDGDDAEDDGELSPPTASGRLTGPALLAKLKELGDASKSDLVRACGYVSTKKNGTDRLNFTAFYEAVLSAKGVGALSATATNKPGRKLSYVTTVQGNGNLMVGKAYTALLDLKPGDEFEIKISCRQIRLVPIGAAQDTESSDED